MPILTHTRSHGVSTIKDFGYNCFLLFSLIFCSWELCASLFYLWEKDALKFSTYHGTHGEPVAAVVVARVVTAGIEVQAPRVARTALAERSRPVATVGACVVEATIDAIAGSGEED